MIAKPSWTTPYNLPAGSVRTWISGSLYRRRQLGNTCTSLLNRWVGLWNNPNTRNVHAPQTVLPHFQT